MIEQERIDALEVAFTSAVNAPSATGHGIAVPHYRDVERIWTAILAALSLDWCGHTGAAVATIEAETRDLIEAPLRAKIATLRAALEDVIKDCDCKHHRRIAGTALAAAKEADHD